MSRVHKLLPVLLALALCTQLGACNHSSDSSGTSQANANESPPTDGEENSSGDNQDEDNSEESDQGSSDDGNNEQDDNNADNTVDTAQCKLPESWWSGTVSVCNDTLTYHDYAFDDYGADTVPYKQPNWDTLSRSTGDVRYQDHGIEVNVADLLLLQLRPEGNLLEIKALLNTVFNKHDAVLAIALDVDGQDTDSVVWDPALIAAEGSSPVPLSAQGVDEVYLFDTADPESNTITGTLPLPEGEFRLWAVTAIANGPVTNLAFRGTDESGPWLEDKQAAALADGDITEFGITLSPEIFANDSEFQPEGGRHYGRVYTSDVTIDRGDGVREGMKYAGVEGRHQADAESTRQVFNTFGRHQPYSVYLPAGWDGTPHPLQLMLHGNGGSHRQIIDQPGAQARFGDELGRILLSPLARGPSSFYSDESERDVLDAWADLADVVSIDPDRVITSGYSMGGYGSYRLASIYPDRFAGLIVWVGPTGHGTNGTGFGFEDGRNNTSGYVGNVQYYWSNLLYNPAMLLYGAADELVHIQQASLAERRFRELGLPHSFWLHTGDHLTLALADDWRKEAAASADLVRREQPARVRFRVEPRIGNPELGLAYDRAWWISEIRAHRSGYLDFADIDLSSGGCPNAALDVVTDVSDINNRAGTDPVPWVGQHYRATGTMPAPAGLTGELANVASLTIDVSDDGACLAGSFHYDLSVADPVILHFSDGRSLSLESGNHTGTLAAPL